MVVRGMSMPDVKGFDVLTPYVSVRDLPYKHADGLWAYLLSKEGDQMSQTGERGVIGCATENKSGPLTEFDENENRVEGSMTSWCALSASGLSSPPWRESNASRSTLRALIITACSSLSISALCCARARQVA
eukprot:scaffold7714_cov390-Prasinococcus_capsulatus_cf.AAC.10